MPVTAGLISAGVGVVGGLVQTGIGMFGGRKARRELGRLESPIYTPSKSINDYYSQALGRYQQSPYQSNLYKMNAQTIGRGTAQGIAGLKDRRSALMGLPSLIQGQNDSLLKAAAVAEQDQSQKFGQLQGAVQMKAGEDRQAFNINKMMPFERKYNQLAQKAAANNQLMNAGMQNIFGGVQSAGMIGAMSAAAKSGNSVYSPTSTMGRSTRVNQYGTTDSMFD